MSTGVAVPKAAMYKERLLEPDKAYVRFPWKFFAINAIARVP